MAERKHIIDTRNSKLQSILDKRQLNLTSVARKAKVSQEVVRKIRDGKTVRRDKFFAVVNSLEVEPKDILPEWEY
jgi:DNA-binding Xre family transcriptional regulator